DVTATPGCSWTGSSDANWITPSSGGTGPGTFRFTVQANSASAPRTATLTIAGQALQVTQAATGCAFSAVAPNAVAGPAGGDFNLTITSTPAACSFSVSAAPLWITLPAGSSGTGSTTLIYRLAANFDAAPRTGTLTVSGTTVQILQQ